MHLSNKYKRKTSKYKEKKVITKITLQFRPKGTFQLNLPPPIITISTQWKMNLTSIPLSYTICTTKNFAKKKKKKIINYTAIFSKKTPIFCLHYLHYHNSRIPIKKRQLNRFYQLYYHNSQIRIKEKQLETFYQLHYHNSKIRIKEKQLEIFYQTVPNE